MQHRDTIIAQSIQAIGEDSFPDDEVTWTVLSTVNKGEYSFVESAAAPAIVGYEKFVFVLRFGDQNAVSVAGCYCWENGQWSLLFTSPDEKDDWKPLFAG
jgi:hypothetical protein